MSIKIFHIHGLTCKLLLKEKSKACHVYTALSTYPYLRCVKVGCVRLFGNYGLVLLWGAIKQKHAAFFRNDITCKERYLIVVSKSAFYIFLGSYGIYYICTLKQNELRKCDSSNLDNGTSTCRVDSSTFLFLHVFLWINKMYEHAINIYYWNDGDTL